VCAFILQFSNADRFNGMKYRIPRYTPAFRNPRNTALDFARRNPQPAEEMVVRARHRVLLTNLDGKILKVVDVNTETPILWGDYAENVPPWDHVSYHDRGLFAGQFMNFREKESDFLYLVEYNRRVYEELEDSDMKYERMCAVLGLIRNDNNVASYMAIIEFLLHPDA